MSDNKTSERMSVDMTLHESFDVESSDQGVSQPGYFEQANHDLPAIAEIAPDSGAYTVHPEPTSDGVLPVPDPVDFTVTVPDKIVPKVPLSRGAAPEPRTYGKPTFDNFANKTLLIHDGLEVSLPTYASCCDVASTAEGSIIIKYVSSMTPPTVVRVAVSLEPLYVTERSASRGRPLVSVLEYGSPDPCHANGKVLIPEQLPKTKKGKVVRGAKARNTAVVHAKASKRPRTRIKDNSPIQHPSSVPKHFVYRAVNASTTPNHRPDSAFSSPRGVREGGQYPPGSSWAELSM